MFSLYPGRNYTQGNDLWRSSVEKWGHLTQLSWMPMPSLKQGTRYLYCSKYPHYQDHIIWELIRKAEFQTPPQTYLIRICIVNTIPRWLIFTRRINKSSLFLCYRSADLFCFCLGEEGFREGVRVNDDACFGELVKNYSNVSMLRLFS